MTVSFWHFQPNRRLGAFHPTLPTMGLAPVAHSPSVHPAQRSLLAKTTNPP